MIGATRYSYTIGEEGQQLSIHRTEGLGTIEQNIYFKDHRPYAFLNETWNIKDPQQRSFRELVTQGDTTELHCVTEKGIQELFSLPTHLENGGKTALPKERPSLFREELPYLPRLEGMHTRIENPHHAESLELCVRNLRSHYALKN